MSYGYYVRFTNYIYLIITVDGAWSVWEDWGTCSVTCNKGTRTRTRTCDNPPPANRGDDCQGSAQQTSECVLNQCPGKCQKPSRITFTNLENLFFYIFMLS